MANFETLTESLFKNIKIYQDFLQSAGLPLPSHNLEPPPGSKTNAVDITEPPPNANGRGPPLTNNNINHESTSDDGGHPPMMGPSLPDHVAKALESAKEASYELHLLLLNPVELIIECVPNFTRALCLNFITRYQIAEKLRPGEKRSFKDIATACNLDENDVRRMLRLAMTDHVFDEPEPGVVAHTKASLMLLAVPNLSAWTETFSSHCAIMAELPEAIGRYPGSEVETETASALYRKQRGLPATLWEYLQSNPDKAIKFGKSMEFISSSPAMSVTSFVQAYNFSKLPSDAVFVDVGGSHGNTAIAVARAHPGIHCVVQDISEPTISTAQANLPADLQGRVEYQRHDFFTEQPVKGADVYFYRAVFHDWSDSHAMKILKTLIPSLKAGSRVVINEICLPNHGQSTSYKQRMPRSIDLMMKSLANAKERDAGEWKQLFAATDARFQFQPIVQPPDMDIAIIEAIWEP